MALVTQADIEARLGRSLTSEEATSFITVNAANQAYIERMIGSNLEAVSESTRYYDGGVQHLTIDPCTNITSVSIVDDDQVVIETIDSSEYTTEPVNKTLKTMVRHRFGKIYRGLNNVGVTAKFSIYADTSTLNIVKNALIDAIVSETDNTDNVLKESIEGYSVEFAKTTTRDSLDSIKYLFPGIL